MRAQVGRTGRRVYQRQMCNSCRPGRVLYRSDRRLEGHPRVAIRGPHSPVTRMDDLYQSLHPRGKKTVTTYAMLVKGD